MREVSVQQIFNSRETNENNNNIKEETVLREKLIIYVSINEIF